MKRLFHLGLWFLLGITIGLFGMYWWNSRRIRDEKALGMRFERTTVDYYAKAEYKYADRESARQALLYDIQLSNQMKGASPLWGPDDLLDLGNSYGELSLLEESAGNPDLARKYMVQAVQALKEADLKEPSASEASIRKRLGKEPFVAAMADGKPQ
jgi:hypothetical protein